jgi:MFS family permease
MVFLYLLAGAAFATIAARGLTVPLYAHELGASRFEVGALFSVSTLAAAMLSLPSGVLVDRFGPRTLLAASLVMTAVSQIATALTPSVAPLFLWQIIGGLAAGIQQSAVFSAVTESVSRGRLGRAMGWLTLSMQLGFTLGPALAGLALRWIDVRTDIAVTTALLVFTIPGALVTSQTRQHTGQGLSLRAPLRALARQAAFAPVVIGLISMTLTWGTFGAPRSRSASPALRSATCLPSSRSSTQARGRSREESSTAPSGAGRSCCWALSSGRSRWSSSDTQRVSGSRP